MSRGKEDNTGYHKNEEWQHESQDSICRSPCILFGGRLKVSSITNTGDTEGQ